MTKFLRFINYPGPDERKGSEGVVREKLVELDSHDTFHEVKEKLLNAFGITEADTFGKVYLQQAIEIRDLDSIQYKDKRFFGIGAFDEKDPIEAHFKRVPVLFLLYTTMKKTRRHVLHIDPAKKIESLEPRIKERFDILPDLDIRLVHQGFLMGKDKTLNDFRHFDPAHSIKIIVDFLEQKEEVGLPLE